MKFREVPEDIIVKINASDESQIEAIIDNIFEIQALIEKFSTVFSKLEYNFSFIVMLLLCIATDSHPFFVFQLVRMALWLNSLLSYKI